MKRIRIGLVAFSVLFVACRATPPLEYLVQPSVDAAESGTGEPEPTPMSELVDSEYHCGIYGNETRPGCRLDSKGRRLVRSWESCESDSDCDWVGDPRCLDHCGGLAQKRPSGILCEDQHHAPDIQCICWQNRCTSSTCGIECRELQRQNASKK